MSDSVQPHRWQPTRLCRPWDSPGKNTGVGCHFLLQQRGLLPLSLDRLLGGTTGWTFLAIQLWYFLEMPRCLIIHYTFGMLRGFLFFWVGDKKFNFINILLKKWTAVDFREGHGNPLQYSCLENPMDRGAWWATVHGVAKSWTWLKRLSMHTCSWLIILC